MLISHADSVQPLAAAANVATLPAFAVWFAGCSVTTGSTSGCTTSEAGLLSAWPDPLVNTARNHLPSSTCAAAKAYVVVVAPATSSQVLPLLVLTCHCTVGFGDPVAVAENVAVLPTFTVWFDGWVAMEGGAGATRSRPSPKRGVVPVPPPPSIVKLPPTRIFPSACTAKA